MSCILVFYLLLFRTSSASAIVEQTDDPDALYAKRQDIRQRAAGSEDLAVPSAEELRMISNPRGSSRAPHTGSARRVRRPSGKGRSSRE